MVKKNFVVTSQTGIHARPATDLVIAADQFKSNIKVTANDRTIDMKSIMGLMSLGMYKGQVFIMSISGEDEEDAMEKLTNLLLENGLAKLYE